ncbi:MAG: hypothetical protein QOI13_1690 [Paraburkholderia sp.]|jgi:hypothetical protein|nr:hypothetical protein [Paraburkholderia sp.]
MKPNFKPPFHAFVKKQHKPLQLAIEDAVEDICAAPDIGEQKAGDLQGVWVYKFTHQRQQYLIAYRPPSEDDLQAVDIELLLIDFYQVGTHENFYATLKKYLKS